MADEKGPGMKEELVLAVASAAVGASVHGPAGALVAGVLPALGKPVAAAALAYKAHRFSSWWDAARFDPTYTSEWVEEQLQAKLLTEPGTKVVLKTLDDLDDMVDDELIPILGALAHEYLSIGAGPDAFYRGTSALLRGAQFSDIVEVKALLEQGARVAAADRLKFYPIHPPDSDQTALGCCRVCSRELPSNEVKAAWEHPELVLHRLRISGLGWTTAVFSGEAWATTVEDLRRLLRVLHRIPARTPSGT